MNLIEGNQQLGCHHAATLFSLFGLLFMWICYSGVKERYVETQPANPAQKPATTAIFPRNCGNRPLFILVHCQPLHFRGGLTSARHPGLATSTCNDPILLSYMGFFSVGCIFIGVFLMPASVRRLAKKVYIGGLI